MNCEIKSKHSDKESHSNISRDVYQGLKLNTDFSTHTHNAVKFCGTLNVIDSGENIPSPPPAHRTRVGLARGAPTAPRASGWRWVVLTVGATILPLPEWTAVPGAEWLSCPIGLALGPCGKLRLGRSQGRILQTEKQVVSGHPGDDQVPAHLVLALRPLPATWPGQCRPAELPTPTRDPSPSVPPIHPPLDDSLRQSFTL